MPLSGFVAKQVLILGSDGVPASEGTREMQQGEKERQKARSQLVLVLARRRSSPYVAIRESMKQRRLQTSIPDTQASGLGVRTQDRIENRWERGQHKPRGDKTGRVSGTV